MGWMNPWIMESLSGYGHRTANLWDYSKSLPLLQIGNIKEKIMASQ
jgi:hypothetical protein